MTIFPESITAVAAGEIADTLNALGRLWQERLVRHWPAAYAAGCRDRDYALANGVSNVSEPVVFAVERFALLADCPGFSAFHTLCPGAARLWIESVVYAPGKIEVA